MPGFADLFGAGSLGQQFLLWNVGSEVASAILAPFLQDLQNRTNELDPAVPLTPATLADMVNRGILPDDFASREAMKSGLNTSNFEAMQIAGTRAADLSLLLEGVRRKLIPEAGGAVNTASLEEGLRDASIRPEYWPLIKALATQIPTVPEVMNAWLEGQITEDEARHRYELAGGDPTWFQTSYDTNGQAPTPNMLQEMLNRRIIPESGTGPRAVSFEQGFLEGPWRNKWLEPMLKLREYLPPPRTVTALIHEGAIDDRLALELFEKAGLSPELAAVYVKAATTVKTASSHALAKSDVLTLYKDRLITEAEALGMLESLRYSAKDAAYELAMADFNREVKLLNAAVSRIHTQYVNHRITKAHATAQLHTLEVPTTQVEDIFRHWDIELSVNVKQLTEAQIVGAFENDLLSQGEATLELERIGYSAFDAWVLLSTRHKQALPNKPPMTPIAGGVNP